MSKKRKKTNENGTYALCITAGVILGIGLGPILDASILITVLIGAAIGAGAGYYFNKRRPARKR